MNRVFGGAARGSRSAIARDTLACCERGYIEVESTHERVEIGDAVRYARENTETLLPNDLRGLMREAATRNDDSNASQFNTVIEFVEETTLEAAVALCEMLRNENVQNENDDDDEKERKFCAILNFASAKNPGGGFLGGASAQEESLARSSALYECIKDSDMYRINRKDNARLVYHDVAVYSPRVPFFKRDSGETVAPFLAGVLTMPAPNGGCLRRGVSRAELADAVARRVHAVLAIAAAHGHTHLVLGAYGCGVFKNDVDSVARQFHRALNGAFRGRFAHVRFAIIGPNFAPFRDAYGRVSSAGAGEVARERIKFVDVPAQRNQDDNNNNNNANDDDDNDEP
jgi:uncharacterized protein (TIGR02452 family)